MVKGKTKISLVVVAVVLILGVGMFIFSSKDVDEPDKDVSLVTEESTPIETKDSTQTASSVPETEESLEETVVVEEAGDPEETIDSTIIVEEESTRDIAKELEEEGNVFDDIEKPDSGMETYNGKEIISTGYTEPYSTVQIALAEEPIKWGGITLLKGEFNFYIKQILGFAKNVTENDNVDGKNVITINLKDYYAELAFDEINIPLIQDAYKHSELYSEDVEFSIDIIYPDGSIVTY